MVLLRALDRPSPAVPCAALLRDQERLFSELRAGRGARQRVVVVAGGARREGVDVLDFELGVGGEPEEGLELDLYL